MTKDFYIWEWLYREYDVETWYVNGEDLTPKEVEQVLSIIVPGGWMVAHVKDADCNPRFAPTPIAEKVWDHRKEVGMERCKADLGPKLWKKFAKRWEAK